MTQKISEAGFKVITLPDFVCSWKDELPYCMDYFRSENLPILVIDHYEIDYAWEISVRPYVRQMIVIDDLANRPHISDILIDQNPTIFDKNYRNLVSVNCEILQGPDYALLRSQFRKSREVSLERRNFNRPRRILISMGGSDLNGVTGRVLRNLEHCALPIDSEITVVLGAQSRSANEITSIAKNLRWSTRVLHCVNNMATLMADADLAIGSAGGTALERCCMGLPSLLITLSPNQLPGGRALDVIGAARLIGEIGDIEKNLTPELMKIFAPDRLRNMSERASSLVDGYGISRVIKKMWL